MVLVDPEMAILQIEFSRMTGEDFEVHPSSSRERGWDLGVGNT